MIATANNIQLLPPELLRKGRFDDIFFVDLPFLKERKEIFSIHIKKRKRNPDTFDLNLLGKESEGFSGADIAAVCRHASMLAMREFLGKGINSSADNVPRIKITEMHVLKALEHIKNLRG